MTLTPEQEYEIRLCARNGMDLLDRLGVEWRTKLVPPLVMWHPKLCVLGQIYGSYAAGISALKLYTMDAAVGHGFVATGRWLSRQYEILAETWENPVREERKKRRIAAMGGEHVEVP